MAWGFRKSRKIGGVRFTFSKSGVSASVGVPGFRVSTGSRGVYVTTGAGGFYYRRRIDAPPRKPPRAPKERPQQTYEPDGAVATVQSAGVEALTGVTQAEFVEELNRVTRRGSLRIVYAGAAVATLVALACSGVGALWLVGIALMLSVGYLVSRSIERRRRQFVLVYDLDEKVGAHYERLLGALRAMATSHSMRGIRMVESIGTARRKYHGGAGFGVTFIPAHLGRRPPPNVETNVVPYCLETQEKQIYFFPDRLIILQDGRFAAVGYDELEVGVDTQRFQWEGALPSDAEVIGQTWRYTNKDGGPDRRFADNYAIPIVRTGELTLRSGTGLHVCVQTTRPDALQAVAGALHALAGNHEAPAVAIDNSISEDVRIALTVFGLTAIPPMSLLRATFRELAKRNHPDVHARQAPAVREFVEHRMKEINAAFAVLRPLAEATPDRPAQSDESPEMPIVEPPPRFRVSDLLRVVATEPYFRSPMLGVVACLAIAVGTWQLERAIATAAEVDTSTAPADLSVQRSEEQAPAPAALDVAPSTRRCPLRTEPGSSATMQSWIPAGAPTEILERRPGWRHVRVEHAEGWMGDFCWSRGRRRSPTQENEAIPDPSTSGGVTDEEAFGSEPAGVKGHPAADETALELRVGDVRVERRLAEHAEEAEPRAAPRRLAVERLQSRVRRNGDEGARRSYR